MIHHVGNILLRSNKPLLTSIFTGLATDNASVAPQLTQVPVFSAEEDKSREDRVSSVSSAPHHSDRTEEQLHYQHLTRLLILRI